MSFFVLLHFYLAVLYIPPRKTASQESFDYNGNDEAFGLQVQSIPELPISAAPNYLDSHADIWNF